MTEEEVTLQQLARGDVADPYSAKIIDIDEYLISDHLGRHTSSSRERKSPESKAPTLKAGEKAEIPSAEKKIELPISKPPIRRKPLVH